MEEVLSTDHSVAFSKMIEGRLFFSARSEGPWRLESLKDGGSSQPVVFKQPLGEGALGPSILKTGEGYLMGFAFSFSWGL